MAAIAVSRDIRSGGDFRISLGVIFGSAFVGALIALIANNTANNVPETLHYQFKAMTYDEPWDEWITEQCSEEECSGSGETRTCHTRYYDCSHRDYHGPEWEAITNVGTAVSISESQFNEATMLWGNKQFIDMHRDYYREDGDRYMTNMPDSANQVLSPRILGYSREGKYENKIIVSRNVFRFREIQKDEIDRHGLYTWSSQSVFGINDQLTSRIIDNANYLYGAQKQLSMKLLVFKNKPMDAGFAQESYWNGGNKNEFTVCVGVNSDSLVSWVKVISWTKNELLKIQVRDSILDMKTFKPNKVAVYMVTTIPNKFIRREFKEFDYLPDAPTGAWVYIVGVLLVCIGFGATFIIDKR